MAKSVLMSEQNETFFTSIGCMDGRVQEIVAKFGRERFEAQYPDTITEAGLVGLISTSRLSTSLLNSLKFKIIDVSLGKHQSRGIVVHGHAECAGNPVADELHKEHIAKSVARMSKLAPSVPIVGIFIRRDSKDRTKWVVEVLTS